MNHEGYVTQMALSSDKRHALTVSELVTDREFRTTATLWNLATRQGRVLDELSHPRSTRTSSAGTDPRRITSARFDPTGQTAIVSRSAASGRPVAG